jgi:catechol 2,3-dioxygenase-like lactoylglutathione lyase family enzyme
LSRDYPFGRGLNLQIRTDDIDALAQRVADHGHAFYLPIEDRWYSKGDIETGNRQFVVADPDGYLLQFYRDLGERTA